jgi:hypothetical protein
MTYRILNQIYTNELEQGDTLCIFVVVVVVVVVVLTGHSEIYSSRTRWSICPLSLIITRTRNSSNDP